MTFDKALNFFSDFLYPIKCGICGKKGEGEVCNRCYMKLKSFEKFNIINFENRNLDSLIYFFKYENYIRDLILEYKFFNKYYLGKVFTKTMLKNEKLCRNLKLYDIIIPVPMYKFKKKERGYNQAEILAQELAKNLNIYFDKNILIKDINNKRQSSLSEKERFLNVNNVFKVLKMDKINNKNVILVDDICTTSATLEECSRILKKYGARKVVGLVIAKD